MGLSQESVEKYFPKKEITPYQSSDEVVEDLSRYFKTVKVEENPDIALKYILNRVIDNNMKDYKKKRVTQSKAKKLKAEILRLLRIKYGHWANIYDFSLTKYSFNTNFRSIYKTELGRLYGNRVKSLHDHLFYTSHSFEQFAERAPMDKLKLVTMGFRKIRKTEPTAADILKFLVITSMQFCETKDHIFVNLGMGILVIEKYPEGIMIVKTFLLPNMDYKRTGWYASSIGGICLNRTVLGDKIAETEICEEIEKPEFILSPNVTDYDTIKFFMNRQKDHVMFNTC